MKKMVFLAAAMVFVVPLIVLAAEGDYTCDLTALDSQVQRGVEGARFDFTVYNNTDYQEQLWVGLSMIRPDGVVYNWLYGPWSVTISAHDQEDVLNFGPNPPGSVPLGTYTFHGYILEPDGGIYHRCQCAFEIID